MKKNLKKIQEFAKKFNRDVFFLNDMKSFKKNRR